MAITVGACNASEIMDKPSEVARLLEAMEANPADAWIISEAFATYLDDPECSMNRTVECIQRRADKHGFSTVECTPYEDNTQIETKPANFMRYLVALGRDALVGAQATRLETRNAFLMTLYDSQHRSVVTGIGMHNEDRPGGLRTANMDAALGNYPSFICGDLNATRTTDCTWQRMLSGNPGAMFMAQHLPRPRWVSVATRALGTLDDPSLDLLEDAEFQDADPNGHNTFAFNEHPILQLDHIMTSPNLRSSNFRLTRMDGLDHALITARLEPARLPLPRG